MATIIRKKKWTDTRSALQRRVQDVLREIGTEIMLPGIKAAYASGAVLEVETGKLARSIKLDRKGLRSKFRKRIRVGTKLQQASIHEFGGKIEAPRGYLTIPLNPEAAAIRRRMKSIASLNLVTRRSRAGNLIMGKVIKRRGVDMETGMRRFSYSKFKPMFVLKKSVVVPKRPVMKPAFREMRAQILMKLARIPKITRITP